jgi:hypothetical protein
MRLELHQALFLVRSWLRNAHFDQGEMRLGQLVAFRLRSQTYEQDAGFKCIFAEVIDPSNDNKFSIVRCSLQHRLTLVATLADDTIRKSGYSTIQGLLSGYHVAISITVGMSYSIFLGCGWLSQVHPRYRTVAQV